MSLFFEWVLIVIGTFLFIRSILQRGEFSDYFIDIEVVIEGKEEECLKLKLFDNILTSLLIIISGIIIGSQHEYSVCYIAIIAMLRILLHIGVRLIGEKKGFLVIGDNLKRKSILPVVLIVGITAGTVIHDEMKYSTYKEVAGDRINREIEKIEISYSDAPYKDNWLDGFVVRRIKIEDNYTIERILKELEEMELKKTNQAHRKKIYRLDKYYNESENGSVYKTISISEDALEFWIEGRYEIISNNNLFSLLLDLFDKHGEKIEKIKINPRNY
ncbi:hypothetical protein SAMN05192551_1205 [Tindallia magadiensis]|uniref:Uncharacterized protein n=1 Tax=Tindallia magadiensis TaxID=69895 RepID=A0A1I3I1W0_9FIRM|nr:hypothetical protein [Tindallia magadiensis]SFI41946.1 hypothetical protein SAMN05192551_1205 [Tindallia magadiensis]